MSPMGSGRRASKSLPPEDCSAETPAPTTVEPCTPPPPSSYLTLDSNSESASETLRSGFGRMPKPTVFGRRAKRTLIRAGGAIDKTFAQKPQILLTATLPGSTIAALAGLAAWSSYIVDRLKTWLFDHCPTSISMYAWEWQRRGALHLHYVQVCDNMSQVKYIQRRFQLFWYDLLETVSQKSGIDMFERESGGTWRGLCKMVQTNVTLIQKSAAGYIAKYLGKGSDSASEKRFCPARWSGVSRNLLNVLKETTYTYKKSFLSFVEARRWMNKWHSASLDRAFSRYSYVHKAGGGETFICYANPDDMETICKDLPPMQPLRPKNSVYSSLIQQGRKFQVLLMIMHGSFMKQLPTQLRRAYLNETAQFLSLGASEFTPSPSSIGGMLAWNATLLYGVHSCHLTPPQRSTLLQQEQNFKSILHQSIQLGLVKFPLPTSPESLLTKSDQACQAGTSPSPDGGSDTAPATKDTLPQRGAFLTQLNLF